MSDAPNQAPERSEAVLVGHAVLVGLTPLIPVPIVDDLVKDALERRLVREVGRAHGVELDDDAVKALVGEQGSALAELAKNAALFPFKLIMRKVFMVLEVKRASDAASLAYHRAYLIERALRHRWLAPLGPIPASDVRRGMDAATNAISISPLSKALDAVFSLDHVQALGKAVVSGFMKRAKDKKDLDGEVGRAHESVDAGTKEKLKQAVASLPRTHFAELESLFDKFLGLTPPDAKAEAAAFGPIDAAPALSASHGESTANAPSDATQANAPTAWGAPPVGSPGSGPTW